MKRPECHPEKAHAAHGLCRACYYRDRRAWREVHQPEHAAELRRRHALAERLRHDNRGSDPCAGS